MFKLYIRTNNWLIGRWMNTGESYKTMTQAISHAKYLTMTTSRVVKVVQA